MRVDNIESLKGCLKIPINTFHDNRGYFQETWNQNTLNKKVGKTIQFAQDNSSLSRRFVLRGLHYQYPKPQAKLLRVVNGSIIDVVVDLRRSSSTFGCWSSIEIEASSDFQLWVPTGFAHGFMAMADNTLIVYKTTDFWMMDCEYTLAWNDPTLAIEWPSGIEPIISEKDRFGLEFSMLPYFD